jgi:hypothetical protein
LKYLILSNSLRNLFELHEGLQKGHFKVNFVGFRKNKKIAGPVTILGKSCRTTPFELKLETIWEHANIAS